MLCSWRARQRHYSPASFTYTNRTSRHRLLHRHILVLLSHSMHSFDEYAFHSLSLSPFPFFGCPCIALSAVVSPSTNSLVYWATTSGYARLGTVGDNGHVDHAYRYIWTIVCPASAIQQRLRDLFLSAFVVVTRSLLMITPAQKLREGIWCMFSARSRIEVLLRLLSY